MVWGCITPSGVGQLNRITGIMDASVYVRVLSKYLLGTLGAMASILVASSSSKTMIRSTHQRRHTSGLQRMASESPALACPEPRSRPHREPMGLRGPVSRKAGCSARDRRPAVGGIAGGGVPD